MLVVRLGQNEISESKKIDPNRLKAIPKAYWEELITNIKEKYWSDDNNYNKFSLPFIKKMSTIIETLRKILANHDEESKKDFFSNLGVRYSVPESFSQMFGFAFSEEDISKAIEQLQNKKET
ncbi:20266_t:CDS:2 [Gigaspora margarita]|uniref:20266_t:CDS:1 n=1 Tax=Gigaspora margarita TaxID=4874 RepID=A0ABM8W233_GIGMA|nr:20266_t:CDS:2 [Gigaspora margarita]